MKYFKIGNTIYSTMYLDNHSDLLLFGSMPEDAFLRRILRCYGIDLGFDFETKKIIFTDLKNKKKLRQQTNSETWSSNDTSIILSFDKENYLNINIKRKLGIDISLKTDLINSINWARCQKDVYLYHSLDYNKDELIEFKCSKFGDIEFTNNKSGYSFNYNTEDLNNSQAKKYTINVISFSDQNRVCYNLENGQLSTIYRYTNNNKLIKKDRLIPFEKHNYVFDKDLNSLMPVINSDLFDLSKLVNVSYLEHLKALKKTLEEKIIYCRNQISILNKTINDSIKAIASINNEIFKLMKHNDIFSSKIEQTTKKHGNSYTKRSN